MNINLIDLIIFCCSLIILFYFVKGVVSRETFIKLPSVSNYLADCVANVTNDRITTIENKLDTISKIAEMGNCNTTLDYARVFDYTDKSNRTFEDIINERKTPITVVPDSYVHSKIPLPQPLLMPQSFPPFPLQDKEYKLEKELNPKPVLSNPEHVEIRCKCHEKTMYEVPLTKIIDEVLKKHDPVKHDPVKHDPVKHDPETRKILTQQDTESDSNSDSEING